MSTHPQHTVTADPDVERFAAIDDLVWFDDMGWEEVVSHARAVPHRWAATAAGGDDGSPYRGIAGAFEMELTVPGAPGTEPTQLPVSGLTWVGVHPDHRRTGVLTTLMDAHLSWCREQGLALAALHASDVTIYGRFGYAVASTAGEMSLGHGATFDAPGVSTEGITTSMHDLSDEHVLARVHAAHQTLAAGRVGSVTRTLELATRVYADPASRLRGTERRRVVIAARDGQDVGYAILRRRPKWEDGRSAATLDCEEWAWADSAAQLALARRLTSVDLVTRTSLRVTADDALLWWCGGPRTVVHKTGDELWLRVLDLPAALSARGWSADCDVVLEVRDGLFEDQAGRWRVTARDGRAEVTRTDDPADLGLDVGVLGATYLGGRRLAALARQGLVEVHDPAAMRALDAALATPTLPVPPVSF